MWREIYNQLPDSQSAAAVSDKEILQKIFLAAKVQYFKN